MQLDVLFMVSSGIGNVLETLYAVEYLLRQPQIKVGLYVEKLPQSFIDYLKTCYPNILVDQLEHISCRYLLHSLTVERQLKINFEHYFYVYPNRYSAPYLSETEQFLSIAKALYPGGEASDVLHYLKEEKPKEPFWDQIATQWVFYPGSSSINPVKRWPYFQALEEKLGEQNVVFLGGNDDLDHHASYVYPSWLGSLLPQPLANQRWFWNVSKNLGVLKPWAQIPALKNKKNAFIQQLTWAELVWILRRAKGFVGNDGGISHLAASAGGRGWVIFGPTSVEKNKPFNPAYKVISKPQPCAPCQFAVGGIQMTKGYINCPFEVKCLKEISVEEVFNILHQNA